MRRSKHNLSHLQVGTYDRGRLQPVGLIEVLPGDTFRHSVSIMLRALPMVNPAFAPHRHTYTSGTALTAYFGQTGKSSS